MGRGIARTLLREGFGVDAWNRTPEPAAVLVPEGAVAHEMPSYAVEHADVAITVVADADAVEQVAFVEGMVESLRPGSVWAQMATIGVRATEALAARVAKERPDIYFVDAPVSGTRGPAENGQLLILASGPEAARPLVQPVFDAIGQRTKWLGEAGAGSRLKLVMNTWLVFLMEGAAEITALADSLGVSHDDIADFLSAGNLASPFAANKLRKMDAGDDSPDFSLRMAVKDIRLALEAAGQPLPALAAIGDRWAGLAGEGHAGEDISTVRHGLTTP
jgi:3-hydroxyisobutyrate dehydrogenase